MIMFALWIALSGSNQENFNDLSWTEQYELYKTYMEQTQTNIEQYIYPSVISVHI